MKKRILILNLILILSINTTFAFSFGFSSFWSKIKSYFYSPKIVSVQTIATTTPVISASSTIKEIKKIKKEDNIISNKVSNFEDHKNDIQPQVSNSLQSEFITLSNGDMKNIKTGQIFKGVDSKVTEVINKTDNLNIPYNISVTNITSTSVDLKWMYESSFNYFKIFDGVNTYKIFNSINGDVPGLLPNTKYTFYISAISNNQESASSSISFTTLPDNSTATPTIINTPQTKTTPTNTNYNEYLQFLNPNDCSHCGEKG